MADIPGCDTKKRKRNKNFTADEENLIRNLVEENLEIINNKFCNEITNKGKQRVWQTITDRVNFLGNSCRGVTEIKEKWGNMTRKAKRAYADFKVSQRKTGGGPAPPEISQSTTNLTDLLKDTASFNGIPGGIDVEIRPPTEINTSNCSEDGEDQVPVAIEVASVSPDQWSIPNADVASSSGPSLPEPSQTLTITQEQVTRPKKKKATQQDVLDMQHRVLKGQLQTQETEQEKNRLQSKKFQLQIKLLEKMIEQESVSSLNNLDASQLFLSVMN